MNIDRKDYKNPYVWTLLGSGDDFESMLYLDCTDIVAVTVERLDSNRGALVIYMKSGHVFHARNVDSYSTAELRREFNIPDPLDEAQLAAIHAETQRARAEAQRAENDEAQRAENDEAQRAENDDVNFDVVPF